jgi:hypothetical protein
MPNGNDVSSYALALTAVAASRINAMPASRE